jgi:hypothetical protein
VPLTTDTKAAKAPKASAKAAKTLTARHRSAKPEASAKAAKATTPKPAAAPVPDGMKRCAGYTSPTGTYSQAEHLLPADTEHFHKAGAGKLFAQCKACANAYQHDWVARKAAAAGKPAPVAKAAKKAAKLAAVPTYADPLAERIALADPPVKGWTTETLHGTIYALPVDGDAVGSPEGQAALEAVNAVRARNGGAAITGDTDQAE